MQSNKTYKIYELEKQILIKKFLAFGKKTKINISSNLNFPFLFMTPKFHKNPVGFRFICSTVNSIGRIFGVRLQNYLKKIYGFLKFKYRNKKFFWSIDNSKEIIEAINELKPNTLQTYDFNNLFTNIPINLLYEALKSIFDFFRIEEELEISRELFLTYCNFCFNNNYIAFQDSIYLQICGIGMGTNFSSTAANLFLFYYEYNYTANNDISIAVYRYIDDLLVCNMDFNSIYKDIYPQCLTLNKTNTSDDEVVFLDLNIHIINNNLFTSLYDKKNDFKFDTLSMPHWLTNLHKKIFINILISQLFRFSCICNTSFSLSKQIYIFKANLFYKNGFPLDFINFYTKICKTFF